MRHIEALELTKGHRTSEAVMRSTTHCVLREGVPLAAGAALWLCVLPLVLDRAGGFAPLIPVAVAAWIAAARGDFLRARLAGGRAPTAHERLLLAPAVSIMCRAQHGPPLVTLLVRRGDRSLIATGAGHRTVMVPLGLIDALARRAVTPHQAAATLIHSAASVRTGRTRLHPLLALLRAPWLLLASATAAAVRGLAPSPLIVHAWRLRAVPGGIAIANFALSHHLPMAVMTALVVGLSYGWTWVSATPPRPQPTPGDDALTALGLTRPYEQLMAAQRMLTPAGAPHGPRPSVTA
ncbi:hypothetical protein [Arthrobacter sp. NEB 688]|uniref:hypothetical protein n=1 Tax=Arthrobacter sp. NEB 688 TaxID=904039 RepID=UPI0015668262|nr:hypothetical protein [Arthrobacter sp. NEB 688]QKE85106.1 hypothetical protein HL663_14965 [Arthrobacter sp. NEB 688]